MPRRGVALVAALLLLLLTAAVLAGLPWLLKAEAEAAREDLAALRAGLAAHASVVLAERLLEATPVESLPDALGRLPPPVHLAAGAIGFAELDPLDSATVEVVAQGFAGPRGMALARRQVCALLTVARVADSVGVRTVVRADLPSAHVECGG
jgi:hypothetical protein